MTLIKDLVNYIGALTPTEICFFLLLIILLVAIVSLIYILKCVDESEQETIINFNIEKEKEIEPIKTINNEENNENVVLDYIENIKDNEPKTEKDLIESITNNIENGNNQSIINLTNYEQAQEEKAIISYDELKNNKDNFTISYEEPDYSDEDTAEISIRKIDLNHKENSIKENIEFPHIDNLVISYQEEEKFLKTLKELQSMLN